jgi:heme-degrading monooxygenase HmoA|tara:strand:- start:105 stop:386 length:282 start_codon:yes stop_codon:yes gene_type:complete
MYYEVRSGKEQDFEEKFDAVMGTLDGQPGHAHSFLYQQVKKHNSYAILSEWDSKDAFTSFINSDTFKQVTDWGKAEILEDRPRHKVYGREDDL